MITGELKSKVDSIWDTIWTGGITSPITVLEQITYLMFMKLLDDNQLKAESNANILGVQLKNKLFKDGTCVISENPRVETDYKNLRWNIFHNFEPEKMLSNIQTYVFPFIKTIGGDGKDTAFSRYMKDTVFLIPTAKVLAKVVDGIDSMDMNNKDIMGDIYEYLLGKIAAAGENGQFRTPRHIINMIVQLMKPTLKDKILDPAMGSAGFLLSSANYINEHQGKELMKTDNLKYYKGEMFSGFDTDQSMLRIGAMNMMLHGVEEPNIKYQDSLSGANTERNAYSLIMANPPFTGSVFQEEISKDLLALCKTKKTELLFMALFIKMLKIGGRCASIVPDGVLFGGSTAHKALRKELVENQHLRAVISMPSGVFKPYAGVSTAVLVFTKTNAGGTDKVWFYDMKADGFSLDDKRNPIDKNDIPDVIERFNNLDKEDARERTEQSFFVPKEEIAENNYDLSINKYKKVEYKPVEYPPTSEILAEIEALNKQVEQETAVLRKLLGL
ncbi:class I SAM-dependent DNA methyltransferase [uncultured Succiniclasticum sp.]|uniref:type I restriction-modification system subunit M n=1 Tax=uncultured Succiniclasticum sp. TaxID=1500547 RepID=UPI0025D15749|nr:class I SAM-dependent DNA methyltransferase [uncultured Succiniclasticum sp.]